MIIATDPIIAITVPASVDFTTKLDILTGDANNVNTKITEDAATAADIALGKKAYVNGQLIVGTRE